MHSNLINLFSQITELDNIEFAFINMDENLPSKKVIKSSKPFVFPKIENIELPQDFRHDRDYYNTLEYIDSSYTQGLLVLQNDTIRYDNS